MLAIRKSLYTLYTIIIYYGENFVKTDDNKIYIYRGNVSVGADSICARLKFAVTVTS